MRELKGVYKYIIYICSVSMVLWTINSVVSLPPDPWIFRAVHLTFALVMIFWLVPARKKEKALHRPTVLDFLLSLASVGVLVYLIVEFDKLIYRVGAMPTTWDILVAIICTITVLEASRRAAGMAFTVVALVALAYAFFGQYLPGLLEHRGYSVNRVFGYVFSTGGIFGSTLRASASYAIIFITLGAFFRVFGAAEFFNKFAMAISGHTRGGPGKVAVLASALFGTISGHAAGNVATTGTFTIPLMKRIGYKPAFAGAVEAAASTGGQILPPVMGTVIFVMIELTGIPYTDLIIAAALPGILYFVSVYLFVDFEAANLNLKGLPKDQLPSVIESLKIGYFFLISIFVLLYLLFVQQSSISYAATATIVTVTIIGFFRVLKPLEMVKKIFQATYEGGIGTMKLAPLTAAAGVVIAVVELTGIGVKLGRFLLMISGGELFFVLFFAMILSIILGMGMSTIPAYVIAASVVAPALIEIGIPVLQAHLFVLYYAILSTITPPIAISAFTAAGIAESNPMRTAFWSVKIAVVGFVVPFLFVYRPALLAEGSGFGVLYAAVIAVIAIYSLARGLQSREHLLIERALLVVGSITLLFPMSDELGIILLVAAYASYGIRLYKKRKEKVQQTAEG